MQHGCAQVVNKPVTHLTTLATNRLDEQYLFINTFRDSLHIIKHSIPTFQHLPNHQQASGQPSHFDSSIYPALHLDFHTSFLCADYSTYCASLLTGSSLFLLSCICLAFFFGAARFYGIYHFRSEFGLLCFIHQILSCLSVRRSWCCLSGLYVLWVWGTLQSVSLRRSIVCMSWTPRNEEACFS